MSEIKTFLYFRPQMKYFLNLLSRQKGMIKMHINICIVTVLCSIIKKSLKQYTKFSLSQLCVSITCNTGRLYFN